MRTSRYLYNNVDPQCSGLALSTSYQVGGSPVMLTVSGLLPGQSIGVETFVSAQCDARVPCTTPIEHWLKLKRGCCDVGLTDSTTQYIEIIPGTYRLDMSSIPAAQPVIVHLWEDEAALQGRPNFNHSTCCLGGGGGDTTFPPERDPELAQVCFRNSSGAFVGYAYSEITYDGNTGAVTGTRLIDPISGGVYTPPSGAIPGPCGVQDTCTPLPAGVNILTSWISLGT